MPKFTMASLEEMFDEYLAAAASVARARRVIADDSERRARRWPEDFTINIPDYMQEELWRSIKDETDAAYRIRKALRKVDAENEAKR